MAQRRWGSAQAGTWDDVPFFGGGDDAAGGAPGMSTTSAATSAHDALPARLGLVGRMRVVVAGCVVVLVLAAVGIARLAPGSTGLVVERAANADAPASTSAAGDEPDAARDVEDVPPTPETVVHVDGAVVAPGVYRLTMDAPRVGDAVEAAGGLAPDADTSTVNLAETLVDGTKVHIWRQGEVESAAPAPETPASGAGASLSVGTAGLVNVNTAGVEQLVTLPGVGEATAQAIIAERERNGTFASVDDLTRVDGIGEKKLAKIRELVCV